MSRWLSTSGNRIVRADGTPWIGRGANIHDTRSCGSCTADAGAPLADDARGLNEVKRRIDELADPWRATFIRLVLESRRTEDNYINDLNYRFLVKSIIDHIGTKPGVYVLVSIWLDTTLDDKGIPTADTNAILDQLARDFYTYDHVMFGVANEPEENYDGAQDAQVWTRMNEAVAAIRAAEAELGPNRHIVTVQGTREWGRWLDYYVTHPIAAEDGVNVAYETHIYNGPQDHSSLFLAPGEVLPVIIGEFAPVNDEWHQADLTDIQTLMRRATEAKISYLAWTFHHFCPPNLVGERPGMSWSENTINDGLGIALNPTDWGIVLKTDLTKNA
jgi:hypothetical protein